MALPEVVSGDQWLAARAVLLAKEKDLTRRPDALNMRRHLRSSVIGATARSGLWEGLVLSFVAVAALAACSGSPACRPDGIAYCRPGWSRTVDTAAPPTAVQFNQELHDELIGMLKRDQSEQAGGPAGEGAAARTERLQAIIRRGRTAVPAARGSGAGPRRWQTGSA